MTTSISSLINNLSLISTEPREEAKIIIANILNKEPYEISQFTFVELNEECSQKLQNILEQRFSGKPLQYILQEAWFYKHKFYVDERVLIPRSESEWLVEYAKNQILKIKNQKSKLVVADVGTGCGAISICLAKELSSQLSGVSSQILIYATDVSEEALEVARNNWRRLLWKDLARSQDLSIKFLHGSLLDPLPEPVNVIIANLPYIPTTRIQTLQMEVKDWEPKVALDGGEDGFELYRKLFEQMKSKWLSPGLFLAEIDYTHRNLAVEEFRKFIPEAEKKVVIDPVLKQPFLVAMI